MEDDMQAHLSQWFSIWK